MNKGGGKVVGKGRGKERGPDHMLPASGCTPRLSSQRTGLILAPSARSCSRLGPTSAGCAPATKASH